MYSYRRDFLKQGAFGLAGATISRMASAAVAGGEMKKPKRNLETLIDAHVHIWTNDFSRYPLPVGFSAKEMKPAVFLPEDILRYAQPNNVNRIVLIQMSYYGLDNSYMLDTIRRSPQVFRGVAAINWKGSDPDLTMRELAKEGVRGFRIFPQGKFSDRCLDGAGLDKMFRYGASARLAICFLINPNALEAVGRRCERFPETPVVIDHLARVGMTGRIAEPDVRSLCGLARYPQVKVKVSAFYALGQRKAPHLDLVPLIRQVYESFGPRRLMWASDCPFQVATETYGDSISVIRDHLDFASADDKAWMLRRSAEETFFL
jgi:predicted TIM-barrel fold metal-dependent hydrolase